MVMQHEPLVTTAEACKVLNVGRTYMTKIKHEMGIAHQRRVFISQIAAHIRKRRSPRHQDRLDVIAGSSDAPSSKRDLKTA